MPAGIRYRVEVTATFSRGCPTTSTWKTMTVRKSLHRKRNSKVMS